MGSHLQDWLNLLLRWAHLVAGISWIGSSFYFMWLDASLELPKNAPPHLEGELWMVHSGGFYQVEKSKIRPGGVPDTLHWFKWEAFFTWLTGIMLLSVIYYMTGGVYLLDPNVSSISAGAASALGLGIVAASWIGYDLLWNSFIAKKTPAVATAICYAAVIGIAYGLCHTLSGRAAFIHVGAIFGTIMVLNVWMRIIPAQKKMVDAAKEGRTPDYSHGIAAKHRSVHNSYMTFPVLFIMLSNHYSMTYSHPQNWLILLLMIFAGAAIRHAMISKNPNGKWALVPGIATLAVVAFMTAPEAPVSSGIASGPPVHFSEVRTVISMRCIHCHSANPTDDVFKTAPNGVVFDTPMGIKAMADRIRVRAVIQKTMPLANKTGITEDERAILGRWIDQGAKIE